MAQCLCDTLLLHGEDFDIAGRSRVDRDGGKTHICQKDLEQNIPPWNRDLLGVQPSEGQVLQGLSLGHTGKNGFQMVKHGKQSCPGVEWLFSLFSCNMFLLQGSVPDEKGQGMLRAT